jgi:hypothetical protein
VQLTVRVHARVPLSLGNVLVGTPVVGDLHETDFTASSSGVDIASGFSDSDREQKLSADYRSGDPGLAI